MGLPPPNPTINPLQSYLPRDIALTNSRMILTRWLAGALVIALTAFCVRVLRLPMPESSLYLIGAAILAYNALLTWLARRAYSPDVGQYLKKIRRLIFLQVGLDWASMSIFLHLTGGAASPAIPFFLIHMLMVTIQLPAPSPFIYVALATAALIVIALLEASGVLPHYTVIPALPPELHKDPIYLVSEVTFFASAAFATVLLAASIMDRLRERERQLSALLSATQAMSSTLDLPAVLESLASSAARALSTTKASIRLLDETGAKLAMVAAHGLSRAYIDKGPVEVSRSGLDREALAGQVVIVKDAPNDPRLQYPEESAAEGIHSVLVVPIRGRAGPLGVLRVYADSPDRFGEQDAEYVMAVASQGAAAIENAMAHDSLQKAEKARAQFVRTVTHELRAPVSGAQSLMRVMLQNLGANLSQQQQEILRRVEARLDMLTELINDLLALAASKTIEFHEAPAPLVLQPLLRAVVEHHRQESEDKGVNMSYQALPESLPVVATKDGLSQVFGNLIGNAVKYTPAGGKVEVRLERQGQTAVVTIKDSGIGIPKEDMVHLWEEFYRASNARQSSIVGTGLGLSIAKRWVETFNGLISVQSREGQGTTFTVTFPLAGSPAESGASST